MPELPQPPPNAVRILNLYSGDPILAPIAGDMEEEFHQRWRESGPGPARRWYWRELFRNLGMLTGRRFSTRLAAWHAHVLSSRGPHARGVVAALLCLIMVRLPPLASALWLPGMTPRPVRVLTLFVIPFLFAVVFGAATSRLAGDSTGEMLRAFFAASALLITPSILNVLESGRIPTLWPPPFWLRNAGVMAAFWLGSLYEGGSVRRRA
jgi:hypothetical protein